jgi:hypothetical protein
MHCTLPTLKTPPPASAKAPGFNPASLRVLKMGFSLVFLHFVVKSFFRVLTTGDRLL